MNSWLSFLLRLPWPTAVWWMFSWDRERELFYDWRFTANQFVLVPSPLRLTARIFFFQLNTCGHSPYITSSLTRGWVCRLQLLLALASALILRSESRRTHNHILLSQIRDSQKAGAQVILFISPRNRVAQLYPSAPGSLSVAFYTRGATVEGIRTLLHTLEGQNAMPWWINSRWTEYKT
jgi:hypothetical protein